MRKHKIIAAIFIIPIVIIAVLAWHFQLSLKNNAWQNDGKIPFAFSEIVKPVFPDNNCNIADYGAISGGTALNTLAFQKSIKDCSQKGGGKVFVPEGRWLTGAIHLKSNINLNLDKNAEIIFSTDPADYLPAVFSRFEGIELYNYSSFIYANGAQNVAISGEGTLNGRGDAWQTWKTGEAPALQELNDMVKENVPVEKRIFGNRENGLRPSFVQFVNCRNVWLEDFSIIQSPRWTIHPIYSENIVMRNLRVDTPGFNSDGIVIDSSKNVLVENSFLKTGDDTISIKSGLDQDGWRVGRPSENIVIRNCDIEDGHSAIAIGSEMSGDVRNVFLYNLRLNGVDQGIRAKSVNGRGGVVENVWAGNISIGTAVNAALKLDLTYPASALKSEGGKIPVFKNFYVDGLSVEKTKVAIDLEGLKSSLISNVNISNIKASSEKGVIVKNCENIKFNKIKIDGIKKPPTFNISGSRNIKY